MRLLFCGTLDACRTLWKAMFPPLWLVASLGNLFEVGSAFTLKKITHASDSPREATEERYRLCGACRHCGVAPEKPGILI